MKKIEVKPGRTVSGFGVLIGVLFIIFGIFWLSHAQQITEEGGDAGPMGSLLILFGVIFIVAAVAITVFYARNAFGKNRPSILDVEETTDDTTIADEKAEPGAAARFCPYCGKPAEGDFSFCKYCGKKIM